MSLPLQKNVHSLVVSYLLQFQLEGFFIAFSSNNVGFIF